MPRIAIKPIDWAAIAKKLLPSDEAAFTSFKAKSEGFMRKMEANPPELPKIDWAYYEKNIPIPGLVDQFKKNYESLAIPYPEDKYTHLIEEEYKTGVKEIALFKEQSDKTIRAAKAVLEYYERLKPVKDWNMEESMAIFPLKPAMLLPRSGGVDLDHRTYHGAPDSMKDEIGNRDSPGEPKKIEKPGKS